jgi:hypothetical protein
MFQVTPHIYSEHIVVFNCLFVKYNLHRSVLQICIKTVFFCIFFTNIQKYAIHCHI